MPISWNEIRQNAIRFSREWAEEHREDGLVIVKSVVRHYNDKNDIFRYF